MLNFIAILFFIELGMAGEQLSYQTPYEYTAKYQTLPDTYYIDLGIETTFFNHIFINGNVETQMVKGSRESFAPYQMKYYIDIGLKYDWLSIGYKRACFHPVIDKNLHASRNFVPELYGGFIKLYIRAEVKLK